MRQFDFSKPVDQLKQDIESCLEPVDSNEIYDVVVIGLGSVGSAACYYLAQEGIKVLGLEQFGLTHENGSHAGQTRIYRKAYFEHPDYVPLLERCYRNWNDLEQVAEAKILTRCGLAYIGPRQGELVSGVLNSSAQYDIPIDSNRENNIERFPQFKVPSNSEFIFEENAGFVQPERAILAYCGLALQHGAQLMIKTPVKSWEQKNDYLILDTNNQKFKARKVIFTSGAWTSGLLPEMSHLLKVSRQVIAWFRPSEPTELKPDYFPAWTIEDTDQASIYYGFPYISGDFFGPPEGLKLGYHLPGQVTEPDSVNREVSEDDLQRLRDLLKKYFRAENFEFVAGKTCLYTNSPDGHFIIDELPENPNIVMAAGFSGHGFKFASGVGEVLKDMTLGGTVTDEIGFLGLSRFPQK